MNENDHKACVNTDRELWREVEGDYYAPNIFVTVGGGIGINVGGYVHVMPLREWHKLAEAARPIPRRPQEPNGSNIDEPARQD